MLTNRIKQGVTYSWLATIDDYPYPASEGWSLRLVMNPRAGGPIITVNSTASGDEHLVQISAAVTATYAAGEYGYEIYAIKAAEQYDLEAGQLTIVPGLLVAPAGTDTRSQAEQALAALQSVMSGTASSSTKRYRINGRELEHYSPEELIKLHGFYERKVAEERRAAGLQDGRGSVRKILVQVR